MKEFFRSSVPVLQNNPAVIYLFKVYNAGSRTRSEVCSKLKTKIVEDINDVVKNEQVNAA